MATETKKAVEVDAETLCILQIIAKETGKTPESLLKLLAQRYRQANTFERSIVLKFLR